VGRFITRDTDLSQLAFVYCDGDPVNAVDPTGYDSTLNDGGVTYTFTTGTHVLVDGNTVSVLNPPNGPGSGSGTGTGAPGTGNGSGTGNGNGGTGGGTKSGGSGSGNGASNGTVGWSYNRKTGPTFSFSWAIPWKWW
jgi:hypothetical protein